MFSEDAVLTERTHARAHTDTHPKKKNLISKNIHMYVQIYSFETLSKV